MVVQSQYEIDGSYLNQGRPVIKVTLLLGELR
jgi:hypothetical protein